MDKDLPGRDAAHRPAVAGPVPEKTQRLVMMGVARVEDGDDDAGVED